jgi:hypothetical protein
MTAITTAARESVVTALIGMIGNVYSTIPAAPVPPAIVVTNDNPWLTPMSIGNRLRLEHRLRVMCCVRDSTDNLPQLEQLVEDVLVALPAAAIVSEVTAPQSLDTGPQGSLLVAEIRLTLHLKEV